MVRFRRLSGRTNRPAWQMPGCTAAHGHEDMHLCAIVSVDRVEVQRCRHQHQHQHMFRVAVFMLRSPNSFFVIM